MDLKPPLDPASAGDAWRFEIPTTEEDIAAQRRIRQEQRAAFRLAEHLDLLKPPEGFPIPRRRTTSEGWEPFRL